VSRPPRREERMALLDGRTAVTGKGSTACARS
jgi:hypothetical protein